MVINYDLLYNLLLSVNDIDSLRKRIHINILAYILAIDIVNGI